MNRPLAVVFATAVLNAAGIALIFPVLPGLLRSVAGTEDVTRLYGAMLALYALVQFVCAPVLGVLSDRYGRRPVLLLSLAGAAVDYLVMAVAPSLWLLFAGRALGGLAGANMAVANAYVADVTPEADRARRFGLLYAFYGSGFVLGSVLGGVAGDIWLREPFLIAALLNGANLVVAWFALPEPHPPQRGSIDWPTLNPFAPLGWALAFRTLVPMLAVFFALTLVNQSYGTVWVLFTGDRFGWTATDIGLSLGLFGLLAALAQVFAIAPLARWCGERGAVFVAMAAEAVALAILALAPAGWMAFAAIPLLALGEIAVPALQTLQANAVDRGRQGQLQGVVASLVGLAAVLGPLLFSSIYALSRSGWPGLVWLVCVAMYLLAAPVLAVPQRAGRAR